jgi:hypothetical protein
MKKVLGLPLAIAVDAVLAVINGWVLSYLWAWFVAAKFGLPGLGIAEAIGLGMTVSYMTSQTPPAWPDGMRPSLEDMISNSIAHRLAAAIFALVGGYVVRGFL